jgi:serine protease Do
VAEVQPKSPAAVAGIRTGDRVTAFDGIDVRGPRDLSQLVADTPPGRMVDISIVRNGRVRTLKVVPTL